MTKTKIEQVFRAIVYAEALDKDSNRATTPKNAQDASEQMSQFEEKAGIIANQHSVAFESLNTQLLTDRALQLEANVRENVEKAVQEIEALVQRTKRIRLLAA